MISIRTKRISKLVAASLLTLLCGERLVAQINSATITGSIVDNVRSVIPGATVTVTNEETQATKVAPSNEVGEYAIPYLAPGRYSIAVDKPGLAPYRQTGIVLGSGQTVRVDVQLRVGSVESSVEVRADALSLQTESSSVQTRVDSSVVQTVPTLNHNPFYFATLAAGVVAKNELVSTANPYSFGVGIYSRDRLSAFSVNGAQAFSNDISVDGVSVMGASMNEALVLPNRDGIQEVRTITNNFSAEYGRGQGTIAIITKSGTNQYHGSLLYQLRNEALNANTFANNTLGIARAPFKVDYYGGTLGGPILKDKLFFFIGYEGLTHNTAADWFATVPTALEKKGDFSKTHVNVNGVPTPLQLFDPFSATQAGANLYQRAPISNSIIPNPNVYALKLASFYPDPNRTPTDVYNANNYFHRGLQTTRKDDINGRIDYHRGNHTFYGTGGIHRGSINTPQPWGDNNPFYISPTSIGGVSQGIAPVVSDNNPYAGIGDTVVLSPSLVLDVRLGFQRIDTRYVTPLYKDLDYTSLGIPLSIQSVFVLPGSTPNFSPGPYTSLNSTNSMHKQNYQTNYHLAGSVTKVVGHWNLKAGVDYRVDLFSDPNIYEGSVTFNSPASFTSQYVDAFGNGVPQNTTAAVSGYSLASILLGAGSLGITPGQSVFPAFADKYFALYTQNDWRATSRLTFNLGLRWDLQPAVTERYNRLTAFDANATNPYGSQGSLAFAGTNGYSRHLWDVQYGDVGPRLGAAYQVTKSVVMRGGYGISYIPTNTGLLHGPFNFGAAPFSLYLNDTPYGTNPSGVPIGTFSDPRISTPVSLPGANPAAPQNYGTGPNLFQRHGYQDGRIQQWNFFIEKRLPGAWIASVGYVGTHGDRLPVTRFPLVSTGLLPQSLDNCYRNGANCPAQDSDLSGKGYVVTGKDPANDPVPNPFNPDGTLPFGGIYAAKTMPRYVRDSQYALFAGATSSYTFGWSNYNALNAEIRHAYANGLQLDLNYTWSKAMDYTGAEAANSEASGGVGFDSGSRDLRNLRNNYHLSYSDIPHRVVATVVYDFPFGAGRRFKSRNRLINAVVGGWRSGAVFLAQSGTPIPIDGASAGSLNSRPIRVPGEPLKAPQNLQRWYDGKTTVTLPDGRSITPCANCYLVYNVDAFAGSVIADPNHPGQYINDTYYTGDAAITYSDIRGRPRYNLDLSLIKKVRLTERIEMEISASATNALNHTQFGGSVASSGAYNMNLGGISVTPLGAGNVSNTVPGQPSGSSTFGTFGLGTFDPRQIELGLKLRF